MASNKSRAVGGKLLAFDLETTSLNANRGHILCAVAKWVGQKDAPRIILRIDDNEEYGTTPASFINDKHIVEALIPLMEEADAVLAYYGSGFDVPYLNTRSIVHKLVPPVPFTVIDPWKTASQHLKLHRNSMDSVSSLVGGKNQKYHLPWDDWIAAQYGDKPAMNRLVKYCINDVETLEDTYFGLRPLMRNHPYLGDAVPGTFAVRCPACGSTRSRNHDTRRTRTFEVFRRRCLVCHTAFESGRRKLK